MSLRASPVFAVAIAAAAAAAAAAKFSCDGHRLLRVMVEEKTKGDILLL